MINRHPRAILVSLLLVFCFWAQKLARFIMKDHGEMMVQGESQVTLLPVVM